MKIKLTKKEKQDILELAKKRHDAKDRSFRNTSILSSDENKNKFNEKFSIDKNYMPHYTGLVGEYVWAKANNLQVDEEIYSVRDNGEDFKGTEVKTITYCGPGEPELKIKQSEYESKTPNLYVLVRLNLSDDEVEILGTITRDMFDKNKKSKRYGIGKPYNFVVPLSKMEKF